MDDLVAGAGSDDGKFIDAGTHVWKKVRYVDSTFTMPAESTFRPEQLRITLDELILRFAKLTGAWLTVEFVQQRLRVKGFELAWATRHKQKDNAASSGRLMNNFGGQRGCDFGLDVFVSPH